MKRTSDEVKKYLDEQYAFNALESAVMNAVNRELTEKEVRYLHWLSRYDCETIDTFVELFVQSAQNKKSLEKFFVRKSR